LLKSAKTFQIAADSFFNVGICLVVIFFDRVESPRTRLTVSFSKAFPRFFAENAQGFRAPFKWRHKVVAIAQNVTLKFPIFVVRERLPHMPDCSDWLGMAPSAMPGTAPHEIQAVPIPIDYKYLSPRREAAMPRSRNGRTADAENRMEVVSYLFSATNCANVHFAL
jgi:hypothetical protein